MTIASNAVRTTAKITSGATTEHPEIPRRVLRFIGLGIDPTGTAMLFGMLIVWLR
jgi:hypothetical protein